MLIRTHKEKEENVEEKETIMKSHLDGGILKVSEFRRDKLYLCWRANLVLFS